MVAHEMTIETDVVIIGSGPAGVSAAWPLVDGGLSVVMLDAAERPTPEPPAMDLAAFRRSGTGWRHAYGDDFSGLALSEDRSPKFATRIGRAVFASGPHYPIIRAIGFFPTRSFNAGGLSKVWGAVATAYDDQDLRGYPIRKSDLELSYQTIAERIGLSGSDDDLSDFHGSGLRLQPPRWLTPIARRVLDRYRRRKPLPGFLLGTARNAVATEPIADRHACNQCGLCLYGCARGAIYDSTYDLVGLRRRPNFRYVRPALVTRLPAVDDPALTVEITGGGSASVAKARALVLAAGTLNSTALVLATRAGAGSKRRLLTNPVAAMAFLVPSRVGRPLPETGFSFGQLSYRLDIDRPPDYATGILYTADSLPLKTLAERLPVSRPTALSLSAAIAPALVLSTFYLPGRFSQNTVALSIGEDAREGLIVEGRIPEETRTLILKGTKRLGKAMRRLGVFPVPGSLSILVPGTDAHLAGTLPMKQHGSDLTCTADCELRPWRNLFIVDGSCLPDLPAKHCTLTIMANADRVGRRLAKQLTKQGAY
jgi:choline dehydrogenase-like flavoprotein